MLALSLQRGVAAILFICLPYSVTGVQVSQRLIMTSNLLYLRHGQPGQVNPAGCARVSPALVLHESSMVTWPS